MASINHTVIRNVFGSDYDNNFLCLPASGTRGGVLIAAKESLIQLQNHVVIGHTISATVVDCRHNIQWTLTGVYGPQGTLDKKCLLERSKVSSNLLYSLSLLLEILTAFTRMKTKAMGDLIGIWWQGSKRP
jgi:hypothetical protein